MDWGCGGAYSGRNSFTPVHVSFIASVLVHQAFQRLLDATANNRDTVFNDTVDSGDCASQSCSRDQLHVNRRVPSFGHNLGNALHLLTMDTSLPEKDYPWAAASVTLPLLEILSSCVWPTGICFASLNDKTYQE